MLPSQGGLICPQDVWEIVVALVDVPGRLVNVLDHLVGFLRRGCAAFAADDSAEPAVRALAAVESLESSRQAVEQACRPLHQRPNLC